MKICLVNSRFHPLNPGGAEVSVKVLAESLVASGHTPVVLTLGQKDEVLELNGVKVYIVALANIYMPFPDNRAIDLFKGAWHAIDSFNPVMGRKVGRILDAERPDLLHTNVIAGFSVAVWGEAKKRSLPLVHTLRDYYLLCPRSTMYHREHNCETQCRGCRMYGIPRRWFSSQVDYVVGISDYILTKHINNGLFVATQHAVVHNAFRNAQVFRTSSRLEPLRFGYIGLLNPTKGIELLLRTFADLPDADVVLVVAGIGKPLYVEMLKEKYGGARCRFLGYVTLEEYYASVDVTVVPSLWHEPLGRVVFESYAFGSPVIGSIRGGIPEIIENGVTGFLFDPDDSSSLTATMKKFVDDRGLVSVMRENCLKKATQFLPEQILDDYLHIYGIACGE
jgi:glycosyltransferase involved in cell wall biosynthesis